MKRDGGKKATYDSVSSESYEIRLSPPTVFCLLLPTAVEQAAGAGSVILLPCPSTCSPSSPSSTCSSSRSRPPCFFSFFLIRAGINFANVRLLVIVVPSSMLDSLLALSFSRAWRDSTEDLMPWLSLLLLSVPSKNGGLEAVSFPRLALAKTPLKPRVDCTGEASVGDVSMERAQGMKLLGLAM